MVCGRKLEERGETSSASVSTKLAPGSAPGRSREARTSGARAGAFQSLRGHPRASPASLSLGKRRVILGKEEEMGAEPGCDSPTKPGKGREGSPRRDSSSFALVEK